ncbi:MAG: MFS transporter permease [Desulfobacterales bacterium]|nr:MFS transporter permease [Desulfobacterales bacterium]MBF0398055.1 MFS transporter permease [Desulfobacterales bacterium]
MIKKIIIPKEQATFWLDKNGRWQNEHGEFEHKKIIDYFHASIRCDENGYHLYQLTDEFEEKVYFNHEDTPFFVFDIINDDGIWLVLNNKDKIKLIPENLFVKGDSLYMKGEEHIVKFSERALLKVSGFINIDTFELIRHY